MKYKGNEYELTSYIMTSSPCSHCAFLKLHKEEICTFPKDQQKECSCELNGLRGWNIKEYRKVYIP